MRVYVQHFIIGTINGIILHLFVILIIIHFFPNITEALVLNEWLCTAVGGSVHCHFQFIEIVYILQCTGKLTDLFLLGSFKFQVLLPLLLTVWNISHFSVLNSVKMDKGLRMQWYDCPV
jgi:hypothetical protein